MANVRYRRIVRDFERRFAHKVHLPHCRLWRMSYVDGELDYLDAEERAEWHVGDERKGDDAAVYGFHCPVHAAVLQDWSTRCGIDWSIPPEEQTVRPPQPPRPKKKPHWQGPARDNPNLHGLAGSGLPLGVTCTACRHRALVPLARIGAHIGNMKEVRSLKFRCSACRSSAWEPTIFHREAQMALFLGPRAEQAA